jgi:leucyl aminopeptidase
MRVHRAFLTTTLIVLLFGPIVSTSAPLAIGGAELLRDLVVLDATESGRLAASDLPVIWKGAGFFLAEWDEAQQVEARKQEIQFRLLRKGIDPSQEIFLFELPLRDVPPAGWLERLLFRSGRKWIIEADPEEAKSWIRSGYSGIRLPREARGWASATTRAAYACGYDALVDSLLAQTSQSRWLDWIEKLSGVEPVTVADETRIIQTRHSSHMFSGDPTARAFDFAVQQAQSWHFPSIEQDPYDTGGQTWKNLVLTIPGQTHSQEVVLITGHLDSVTSASTTPAPGANDNGTGSATLFEAARLLRQLRFERTIQIVWFTGEEDGLLGSEAFVADHPTSRFLGAINLDMFGWDGDGDRCFEIHAGTLSQSQDVGNCFADSVAGYALGLSHDFLTVGATDRSDHASFWQVDVGAIEIAENFFSDGLADGCVGGDPNPGYHTTNDTLSNVTPPFGFDIARGALAAIASMAVPIEACFHQVPTLSATEEVSSVALDWSPVDGASSYRVYRSEVGCEGQWFEVADTPATLWQDDGAVEARTYYYQVEAVDADGFCVSPASACVAATPTIFHATPTDWTAIDVCAAGGVGDGDGIVDPGESLLLPVTLLNDGNTDLSDLSGTLFTAQAGVVVIDPRADWPDLPQGAAVESTPNHFGLQVGTSVSCEATIDASIDLAHADGSNTTALAVPIGAIEQSMLLQEDFAAGIPPDWTVSDGGVGGGAAATWTTTNPGQRSIDPPIAAFFAIVDSDAAGSAATQDESLISPPLDGNGCEEVTLEFTNQFRWYSGGLDERGDVDVSADGTTWTNVLSLQGGSDGYTSPSTQTLDITAAIAADPSGFQFRFHYHQADYEWWWAVDNVSVQCSRRVCSPCAAAVAPPGEPSQLTVDKSAGTLLFDWDPPNTACGTLDYTLYRGDLASLHGGIYDHDTILTCQSGDASLTLPLDDARIGTADYYLAVAGNGLQEGSYGRDSSAIERPAVVVCNAAQNLETCTP